MSLPHAQFLCKDTQAAPGPPVPDPPPPVC